MILNEIILSVLVASDSMSQARAEWIQLDFSTISQQTDSARTFDHSLDQPTVLPRLSSRRFQRLGLTGRGTCTPIEFRAQVSENGWFIESCSMQSAETIRLKIDRSEARLDLVFGDDFLREFDAKTGKLVRVDWSHSRRFVQLKRHIPTSKVNRLRIPVHALNAYEIERLQRLTIESNRSKSFQGVSNPSQ